MGGREKKMRSECSMRGERNAANALNEKERKGLKANEGATGEWIRTGVREERKSGRTKASNERVRHSVRRKERAR